jgi:2'-5' RNA ligase
MRLFIATQLPAAAKSAIEACVASLRKDLPDGSWAHAENLHLTWAFIGDQPDPAVQRLHEEILSRIGASGPVAARLAETGFFPDARRARVGWIALEPRDQLNEIASAIRQSLHAARVPFDEKPFRAHVTLVRPKTGWRVDDTARFAEKTLPLAGIEVPFTEVSIYESKLSSRGAIHTPLRTIPLSQEIGGQ